MSNCYDPSGNSCRAAHCIPHFEEAMLPIRTAIINKQVRMASSQLLRKLESLTVIKEPGQGSNNVGGPGNATKSLQISTSAGIRGNKLRAGNYGKNGAQGHTGVDRKHGSYVRYLNRKVGSILRAEPLITRTALIGQPRSRTGTTCGCGIRTSKKEPGQCLSLCTAHVVTSSGNWLPDPSTGLNAGFLLTDFTVFDFVPDQLFASSLYIPSWNRHCCAISIFKNAIFNGLPILGFVTYFNFGTWRINIYWRGEDLSGTYPAGTIINHTTGVNTSFSSATAPTSISNWSSTIGPVTTHFYTLGAAPIPISVGDSFSVVFS